MSVSKMKMVSVTGKLEHLDEALAECIKCGCFHPEQTAEMVDKSGFKPITDDNPFRTRLGQLLEVLSDCNVEPEYIGSGDMTEQQANEFLTYLHDQLVVVQNRKKELDEVLARDENAIEQLSHFESLDIKLDRLFNCKYIKTHIGRLPAESYRKLKALPDNPYVIFLPCSLDNGYYWGMYVCPETYNEEANRFFASLFFERLHIDDYDGTPAEAIAHLTAETDETKQKIEKLNRIINSYFEKEHDRIMHLYSYLKHKSDICDYRRCCAKYKDYFMLIGWVPAKSLDGVSERLTKIDSVEIESDDPENIKKCCPPSRLKNRFFFRPFEMFVSMYGLPGYNEVDPTAFIAVTYTLLYGIMFADLGHGLVLSAAGFIMYKLMKMQIGKVLIPCGISGAFFGIIFGSFFGYEHALDPFWRLLGFDEKPIDIMSSSTMLLGMAILIGSALVLLSMCVNIYSSFKRRDIASAVFGQNGFVGIVLYISIFMLAAPLVVSVELPATGPTIALIMCVVLIFFRDPLGKLVCGRRDWKPKKLGEFVLDNAAEMFEVLLSYITNSISFLRVGAFILVHAGMMMAFFSIADMFSGTVGYYIVVVLANILVCVLEGLLVGIQVLRLEFYEMFSRFYIGEGREYKPMSEKAVVV
ncbi:MAG: V-type ATPase 116kDa subunit family protein, partial [Firmicutes bacterium]|nr:V-type ATPase 116kDa subunit family protein [Bacillota bacterium]